MTLRSLGLCIATSISLLTSGCAAVVAGGAATSASVVHDRRTAGAVIEDQSIELRVDHALDQNENLHKASHINVTAFNGMVLLTGETPTEAYRNEAGELARVQDKVRRVYNELTIAAPSSAMTRSSDAWITTKAKSMLLGVDIKGFDPTRIKVVTENGTVYLMGLVYHAEADATVARVQQISGVQRIVKLFEYLD